MDLLVVQLKAAIRRLLDTKGVRGRVLDNTIMFSQTLGTALGDWTADTAGLGYGGGAIIFSVLRVISRILIITIRLRLKRI